MSAISEPSLQAQSQAASHAPPTAPSLALVIPTLREASNIRPLLNRVRGALDPCGFPYEVIVVDDQSADGTEKIVAEMAREDARIRCIVRRGHRGLAGAVLRGWSETGAPLLAVMDADLQHPPELLPKLWTELEAGADLVIGSRYTCGGSLRNWNAARHLLSRIAIWLTRPVQRSGLRVCDPMSGFFMVRRSCIDPIDLQPAGFKILLEILARAPIRSVVEVPFSFARRHAGTSKAGVRTAIEYVTLLIHLYRQKSSTHPHQELEIGSASLSGRQEPIGG